MSDEILCEKCGAPMRPFDSKKPIGMTCDKCGWGWATSFIEPIYSDMQIYAVTLNGVASVTKEAIKTISEITNQNFLQAKRTLESLPQTVFSGKAQEVLKICGTLKSKQCFDFEVSPDFPYKID